MLKKLCNRKAKCALYALLLLAAVIYSLLFSGFTGLTAESMRLLGRIRTAMNAGIYLLAFLCAVMELFQSWPRALLSVLLLALRWRSPLSWQMGMLLDTVLLALLSDLGTEKTNGYAWLAAHVVYIPLLFAMLRLGWVNESFMEGRKGFWIFQTGHSYGMSHPNNFAVLFMSTWMALWVLFLPKRGWIAALFFWVGAFMMYAMTLCRTAAVLMLVFPVLYMLLEAIGRSKHPGLLRAAAAAPLLAAAVTVALGLMISTFRKLFPDGAFWLRFSELRLLQKDGLTLFGAVPTEFAYFDNFYLWLPMYCGLIPTVGVLAVYSYMIYGLARDGRIALLAVAALFVGYGLMENAVAYAVYFFVPLLAFANSEGREKILHERSNKIIK